MSKPRPSNSTEHLGLIGGLGTAAGIFYYEKLVELHSPLRLTLAHADLPTMMRYLQAQDWAAMADYLVGMIESLAGAGATFAAISAVTPHIVFDRIAPRCHIPLISVLDVLPKAIAEAGLTRIALFGTKATVESRVFGTFPQESVVALGDADSERVYQIYADVARGKLTQSYRDEVSELARRALDRGAEAIVLAGTDLSALFRDQAPKFPHVDAAHAHIDAISDRLQKIS
ncbi:MAG: aspartate/glutamate racemase family protein [Candidatus Baltobacteraceae bacterium]